MDYLYVACDHKYYVEHGRHFIASSLDAGQNVHVHVIDPQAALPDLQHGGCKVRYSWEFSEQTRLKDCPQIKPVTYYACSRFLILPWLLRQFPEDRFLALDVDSLVLRPVEFPSAPVGLFTRPQNPDHMKIAAGAVYVENSDVGRAFADRVRGLILAFSRKHGDWFLDQLALLRASMDLAPGQLHRFDNRLLDWEFTEGSMVWTGKGPRKHHAAAYRSKREEFDSRVQALFGSAPG